MAKEEEGTTVVHQGTEYIEDDGSDLVLTDADLGPTDQEDIPSDLDKNDSDGVVEDPDDDVTDDGEYKPDFSYKVYDEEREIPEEFRSLITDKESEERIRGIMARADGLDGMKAKNEKVRGERDNYREQLDQYGQQFQQINEERERAAYYRDHDIGLFLRHHGVTDDQIFEYANHAYDAREKPEVRNSLDQRAQNVQQTFESNRQNQSVVDAAMQSSNRVHQEALDMAMQNPEVAEIAAKWDTRVETPGDFLSKVGDYGNSVYQKTGKNISPFEAVKYVADTYSKVLTPDSTDTGRTSGTRRQSTIPSVGTGGGGRSPARKRPRDIDEFDKMIESGSY